MDIDEIGKKIAEDYDNAVAKAFVYQVASLLRENGIVVNATEHVLNEMHYVGSCEMEYSKHYAITFDSVDTTEHDAKVKADEQKKIMEILDNADDNAQAMYLLGQYLITEQLKEKNNG